MMSHSGFLLSILAALTVLPGCVGAPGQLGGPSEEPTAPAEPAPAPRCVPVAEVMSVNPTEGDTVRIALDCSADVSRDEFLVEAVSPAGDIAFDEAMWEASWQTGSADAGEIEFVFMVRWVGAPTALPETLVQTVWIADDANPAGVPPDPTTYDQEYGLPVLHLDPFGELSEDYLLGDAVFAGEAFRMEMKIRGASSAAYPKNSYTLKTVEGRLDLSDYGLGAVDHLVLVTTFDDNAYVRQKVIYDTWAAMAEDSGVPRMTPATFFVVVYLEDQYRGLFMVLDHIDNEFMEARGHSETANLYKSVSHDANFRLTLANGASKTNLHAGWEKKEGLPESGAGAFDDLDALTEFVGGSTTAEFLADADQWLDIDEFIDWFLLVHYTSSGDSAGKNAYLVNDLTSPGFRFVPWDFNHSYGQSWRTSRIPSDMNEDFRSRNKVFDHLQTDPATFAAIQSRLDTLMEPGAPLSSEFQLGRVDELIERLDPSCRRDWARWSAEYYSFGRWADDRTEAGDWQDYDGEVAYLRQWLAERAAFMATDHL